MKKKTKKKTVHEEYTITRYNIDSGDVYSYCNGRMLLELHSVRSGLRNLKSETIYNDLKNFIDFTEMVC